jgi:hypothetical protein
MVRFSPAYPTPEHELLEIHHFESREIADKAAALRHLLETYITP